ncbi:DNA-3-methyladenine glycosylase I [Flavobacterium zepuense]|uniref:DNA-3-methyladenine glycosylase I n=1 Tax=Flavobacterium zepuense TaxID=2593302 RepID=UPI0037442BDA
MSYCSYIAYMAGSSEELHKYCHDHQYGFPIHNDNELFGRLIFEINQAGLSWETILKKQQSFRNAYSEFDIAKVASYSEVDRKRLLADAGIIRNKLKVNATIENAKAILQLQKEYGSFEKWLEYNHPMLKEE